MRGEQTYTTRAPFLKRGAQRLLRPFGYQIERRYPRDYSPDLIETIERVTPLTMTSDGRIADTCAAAEYVTRSGVPGDIVECGVWKGGSMMAIALTLLRLGSSERNLYLFDTFAGMSEPTETDVSAAGSRALDTWRRTQRKEINTWCYAPVEEVEQSMHGTGYNKARIRLVKGKVEDTIPEQAPPAISLLRLDTDWYESTRHELIHLFPRLSVGGVLLMDDYGTWAGARRAADEYFSERGVRILLHRSDASGRMAVKQAPDRATEARSPELHDALRLLGDRAAHEATQTTSD